MNLELDWSDWTALEQFEEMGNVPYQQAGVYQIRVVAQGQPVPIPRWLGEDENGLLYIGCTKTSIGSRLSLFRDGIHRHTAGHTAGKKRYILQRWIPAYEEKLGGLQREYRWVATQEEFARKREEDVLQSYVATFGEAPPLNGSFAYRMEPETWEERYGAT
jgi:hypothetical protein